MFSKLGKLFIINTLYKKMTTLPIFRRDPWSLISRVERLKTIFMIQQMSQIVKLLCCHVI